MSGKSLAKAFIIGLVVYVALNFGLGFLSALTNDTLDAFIASLTSLEILLVFFSPIMAPPSQGISNLLNIALDGTLGTLVTGLSLIVPGIIAAVVSTRFNETRYESFGAWFLIAIVSFVIALIISIMGILEFLALYGAPEALVASTIQVFIVTAIVGLLANMAFYGFFACVSSKNDIY